MVKTSRTYYAPEKAHFAIFVLLTLFCFQQVARFQHPLVVQLSPRHHLIAVSSYLSTLWPFSGYCVSNPEKQATKAHREIGLALRLKFPFLGMGAGRKTVN